MEKSNPMEIIGFRGISESFIVFTIFGAGLIVFGGIAFDLTSDLPDQFSKTIQEPLSINTFAILSVMALGIIALVGLVKGENALKHPIITKGVLAFSRVGLSVGAIVAGMLLGIGAALWFITLGTKDSELAANAIQFLGLAVFFLLFIVPLIILHLYLLYPWGKKVLILDVISISYACVVVALLFNVNNYLGWQAVSLQFTVLLIFSMMMKWLKRRNA